MRYILTLLCLSMLVCPVQATCFDEATKYERAHPEWDCVTIGYNQMFKGVTHMVNYQVDGDNLKIHDGWYGQDYTIYKYKTTGQFFHFWNNDKPIRNYKFLRANNPQ